MLHMTHDNHHTTSRIERKHHGTFGLKTTNSTNIGSGRGPHLQLKQQPREVEDFVQQSIRRPAIDFSYEQKHETYARNT